MPEKDKLRVVLDLDQSIISAEPTDEYDFRANKTKARKFKYHDMDGYYIVFERPGVQKFLDDLFKNYIVSVWTAASKDYALFVINNVILKNHPERKIDYMFFSYHCDISKDQGKGSKDLSLLWKMYKIPGYNKDNTVIFDDYDEVHETQPGNCIIAKPFEFTNKRSENDDFLDKVGRDIEKLGLVVSKGGSVQKEVKRINDESH